jgi:hypothetical protein
MSSDNRRALLHEVAAGSAPDSEKGVSTNAIIYLLRVLVLLRVQLLLLLSDAMPLLLFLSLSSWSSSSSCRAMNEDLAVLTPVIYWRQKRCMCYAHCLRGEKPVTQFPTVATTAPPLVISYRCCSLVLHATSLQMVRVCVRLVYSQVRNEHAVRTNRCVFFLGYVW